MAFENNTNTTRVQKMIETLGLILKSAHSNQAEPHAIQDMLRPLTDELAKLGVNTVGTIPEQEEQAQQEELWQQDKQDNTRSSIAQEKTWGGKSPQWQNVREMAEKAELKDLVYALAVFMNRIDDVL